MNEKNNLVEVIKTLYKWRKHVLIITSAAAVGSIIVSLLMPNYYKSTCIFYPYSPKVADARTLYMKDINYDIFGQSADVDRVISIANSSLIIRDMVREFDLINHYKIDTSSDHAMFDGMKEFRENIEIIKNDEGAIELTIYDQNDSLADVMVKTIVGKINYINIKTTLQNNEKTLEVYGNHLASKTEQLNKLVDSLQFLRKKYNILNPTEESKYLTLEILKAKTELAQLKKSGGSASAIRGLESKIQTLINGDENQLGINQFKEASDIIKQLDLQLVKVTEEYNQITESYQQTKSAISSQVQSLFIVEDSIRAEKKSKPIRWVIVLSTTLVAFLLSSLLAVMLEFYNTEVKHLLN